MRSLALAVLLAGCAASGARAAMRVVSVEGKLATAQGRLLVAGDTVPSTELTLSKGRAVFETDAGRFQLKGPASMRPYRASIFLKFGGLLSVLPRLKGRRFRVRTPTAVAAVRGTDFFVEARSDDETYVCVCKGKLSTEAKGLPAADAEAEHHAARRFVRSGAAVEAAEAGLEGHTDEELDALRAAAE